MDEQASDDSVLKPAERGVPLVATTARWLAVTAILAFVLVVVAEGYLTASHSPRPLSSLSPAIAAVCAAMGAILWLTLLSEELRLGRELRIARTGTAALRVGVTRRRQQGSVLTRLLSTRLGTAAVLLAQGERADALDALGRRAPLMEGGRLDRLRAMVT